MSALTKKHLLLRSLAIAGGLVTFKIIVFFLTNSAAILASAADSAMDLLVSLMSFVLVTIANRPADDNHAYGHGKIESVAGLLQSMVIAGVTLGVGAFALKRFFHPEPLQQPLAGILMIAVALGLSIWHVRGLRQSVRETNSQLMATEYLHYASDIFMNIGVLVALFLTMATGWMYWDPLITLFIVMYLMKSVAGIFTEALGEVLDQQLSPDILTGLDRLIRTFDPRIVDYHDLRTRKVADRKFIEFHVVLRDVERFHDAHDLTEQLISAVRKAYPGSTVTVHADPDGVVEEEAVS